MVDMDGTLVDTDHANFLAYRRAVADVIKREIPFVPSLRMTRDRLNLFLPDLSMDAYLEILERKERYYELYLSETRKNSRLEMFLREHDGRDQLLVLVTKSKKERALKTMEYHGLVEKFGAMFFKDDACVDRERNKYRQAIRSLDLDPGKVIVFENEGKEVSDAKKCGIQIINPTIN